MLGECPQTPEIIQAKCISVDKEGGRGCVALKLMGKTIFSPPLPHIAIATSEGKKNQNMSGVKNVRFHLSKEV